MVTIKFQIFVAYNFIAIIFVVESLGCSFSYNVMTTNYSTKGKLNQ